MFGIRELAKIILKDVSIRDTVLQQIMLIHVTKMNVDLETKATMIVMLKHITTDVRFDRQQEDWATIAYQTANNSYVSATSLSQLRNLRTQCPHIVKPCSHSADSVNVGVRRIHFMFYRIK